MDREQFEALERYYGKMAKFEAMYLAGGYGMRLSALEREVDEAREKAVSSFGLQSEFGMPE